MLGRSAHIDTFARDNLPPVAAQPDFLLDGFNYPDRLNIGVELTDAMIIFRQQLDDLLRFVQRAHERHHDFHVGHTHFIAHFFKRHTFQRLGRINTLFPL